jgi:hypothetical protein
LFSFFAVAIANETQTTLCRKQFQLQQQGIDRAYQLSTSFRRGSAMKRMLGFLFFSSILILQTYGSLASYSLNWAHFSASKVASTDSKPKSTKNVPRLTGWRQAMEDLVSGTVKPGPQVLQHSLYWLTAVDAVLCVFLNEYSSILTFGMSRSTIRGNNNMVPMVLYSKLFYFAQLSPRLLYSVGALLRALQLCTPFRCILDPTIGVGAGINLCAIFVGSLWVKPLVLGWATTKWAWTWLGARQVEKAYVPITVSIREWEERKQPK